MTFHPNSPHGPGPHGLADRLTARDTVDMKCHRSTTSTIGAIFAAASCQEHRMSTQCHKPIKVLPISHPCDDETGLASPTREGISKA